MHACGVPESRAPRERDDGTPRITYKKENVCSPTVADQSESRAQGAAECGVRACRFPFLPCFFLYLTHVDASGRRPLRYTRSVLRFTAVFARTPKGIKQKTRENAPSCAGAPPPHVRTCRAHALPVSHAYTLSRAGRPFESMQLQSSNLKRYSSGCLPGEGRTPLSMRPRYAYATQTTRRESDPHRSRPCRALRPATLPPLGLAPLGVPLTPPSRASRRGRCMWRGRARGGASWRRRVW